MMNERYLPATKRQIGLIYWRGKMYYGLSQEEVDKQVEEAYGVILSNLTQHQANLFINKQILDRPQEQRS